MTCPYQQNCGGCPFRNMQQEEYRQMKINNLQQTIKKINQANITLGEPVFIPDGNRRRAELAFCMKKGNLTLGFNERQSSSLINIDYCQALTANINNILAATRKFLEEFCRIEISERKKSKILTSRINAGDIKITEAANGIDILLVTDKDISLEHRQLICDFANENESVIRVSVQKPQHAPETIVEKNSPYIKIGGYQVYIAAGTFLQASTLGESALIDLVQRYIGDDCGNIADLFCGIGTFSYPLSNNPKNRITAADSSEDLLNGFQKSVNKNVIQNIKICKKNLFKYPFDAQELKEFDIVVFDPPRAGASAQCNQISLMNDCEKPKKIIAVSCNPHTFVNDSNTLLESGYKISEITLVDQFVFAAHSEIVALFEKN